MKAWSPNLWTTSDFLVGGYFFGLFIFFWLHWVFVAASMLSLVVASRGSLSCAARFLIAKASLVAEHRL